MTIALGMPTLAGRTAAAGPRPASIPGLIDSWGRVATDLRISLTDRCNLRCTYCMPAENLPSTPTSELMQADKIERLARIAMSELGVRQVRFTGGEPLLRKDLVDIVARVAALTPRPEISVTTNKIGLASRASALAAAGLGRINVSLDTVHAATFLEVTRRPFLDRVLAGPPRRDSRRSRSTRCSSAASTTTRRPSCSNGASFVDMSCASSNRCRWTPTTPGTATPWSLRPTSATHSPATTRWFPQPNPATAHRPNCSTSFRVRCDAGRSALSPPSRNRSAPTAGARD